MKTGVLDLMGSTSAESIINRGRSAPHSTSRCCAIIPVRHGGEKFEACLASVIAAIHPGDEVIVVADGEGDGSWRKALGTIARIVRLPSSVGPACARNAGAEKTQSDILFFVDADVTIPTNAVTRIRETFATDKELAALIGSYDGEPREANFLSQYKNLFHHFVHQHGSADASTFWGACGAIRREVFVQMGGFDPTYERPSIEDIELGYRLKAASFRIRLLPDLQVKHLKRWDARSLIKTDLLDRAAPWTELIWSHFIRRKPRVVNDLNLGSSFRLSLVLSFLLVIGILGTLFTLWILPIVLVVAFSFVLLQVPFFRFFKTKRGFNFALRALAWRFGYDIYSGLGFCYGSLRFANSSTRRILSQAFARLDPIALGVGVGGAWGGGVSLATIILLMKGGDPVRPNLSLLGQFFPGYNVTWLGSLVGLLYGVCAGFLFGFSFAFLRNIAMRLHLSSRRVQRFVESVRHSQVNKEAARA